VAANVVTDCRTEDL